MPGTAERTPEPRSPVRWAPARSGGGPRPRPRPAPRPGRPSADSTPGRVRFHLKVSIQGPAAGRICLNNAGDENQRAPFKPLTFPFWGLGWAVSPVTRGTASCHSGALAIGKH